MRLFRLTGLQRPDRRLVLASRRVNTKWGHMKVFKFCGVAVVAIVSGVLSACGGATVQVEANNASILSRVQMPGEPGVYFIKKNLQLVQLPAAIEMSWRGSFELAEAEVPSDSGLIPHNGVYIGECHLASTNNTVEAKRSEIVGVLVYGKQGHLAPMVRGPAIGRSQDVNCNGNVMLPRTIATDEYFFYNFADAKFGAGTFTFKELNSGKSVMETPITNIILR